MSKIVRRCTAIVACCLLVISLGVCLEPALYRAIAYEQTKEFTWLINCWDHGCHPWTTTTYRKRLSFLPGPPQVELESGACASEPQRASGGRRMEEEGQ